MEKGKPSVEDKHVPNKLTVTDERFEEICAKLTEAHANGRTLEELFTQLVRPDETIEELWVAFVLFCDQPEVETTERRELVDNVIEKLDGILPVGQAKGRSSMADLIESLEEYDEESIAYKKALRDKYLYHP